MSDNSYQQIFETRLSRRDFVRFSAVLGGTALLPSIAKANSLEELTSQLQDVEPVSSAKLSFKELTKAKVAQVEVPEGYDVDILLRWGAGLFNDSPKFDAAGQTAESQSKQFGYNCDFTAFFPLPAEGYDERGLLCVNHEYPIPQMMFKNFGKKELKSMSKEQVGVCMQSVGVSVVEITRKGSSWGYIQGSKFNRRITATTEIEISGAASGHSRLKTSADAEGTSALGTLGNCAGGVTP